MRMTADLLDDVAAMIELGPDVVVALENERLGPEPALYYRPEWAFYARHGIHHLPVSPRLR